MRNCAKMCTKRECAHKQVCSSGKLNELVIGANVDQRTNSDEAPLSASRKSTVLSSAMPVQLPEEEDGLERDEESTCWSPGKGQRRMRPWSQPETLKLSALRDGPKDAFETARRAQKTGGKVDTEEALPVA